MIQITKNLLIGDEALLKITYLMIPDYGKAMFLASALPNLQASSTHFSFNFAEITENRFV